MNAAPHTAPSQTPKKTLKKAAVIGGGVIGGGWAARLALAGVAVTVADPDPDATQKINAIMENAKRAMARLWPHHHVPHHAPENTTISYAKTIGEAVSDADLVQESAPERLDLKQRIHQEIGEAAPPDCIIGSSTSGLLPSDIQATMPHPERMIVAHPYNPVYLLPVVEIVGGKKTDPKTIAQAMQYYTDIGMKPVHIEKEIDAFVGDRLLEAMWRESLWLINDGIATAQTIDDVVRYGLGLRYAQMGQFMTYRLGGGAQGMRHFLKQFGPSLAWPWTRLMDTPPWSDDLINKIARQSDEQAQGKSIQDLEQIRDNNLVDILKALRANDWGAGAVLKEPVKKIDKKWPSRELPPPNESPNESPNDSQDGWLETWSGHVLETWIDYNGHMTEFRYLEVFSMATEQVLAWIGGGEENIEKKAQKTSWYTLETHIKHLDEVAVGKAIRTQTQLLEHDAKRMHLFHKLYSTETGTLLATGEHIIIHVDMDAGRSTPMPPAPAALCQKIAQRQADMPRPPEAGAAIGFKKSKG